jgi:large subunit ribosomal protein L28
MINNLRFISIVRCRFFATIMFVLCQSSCAHPDSILIPLANLCCVPILRFPLLLQPRRSELVMRERKCDLSGTRKNSKCMNVSKSNAHTHRVQNVNLQTRKLWWEEGNKFVRIRISARTLKTIQKNGLDATAKKFSIDLNKFSLSSGSAPLVVA